jgi:hypothetical protein
MISKPCLKDGCNMPASPGSNYCVKHQLKAGGSTTYLYKDQKDPKPDIG